nr:aminotransferase class IV [Microbulbifer elongatus]
MRNGAGGHSSAPLSVTDILPLFLSADGEQQALAPDRAFQSGLLETMRAQAGSIPLLPLHLERLARSARLQSAQRRLIEESITAIAARTQSWPWGARVRLRYGVLATGGDGHPQWDISAFPLSPSSSWDHGAVLALCNTHLSESDTRSPFADSSADSCGGSVPPEVRGCKLLVRGTYGQAAREWRSPDSRPEDAPQLEPLLCDPRGFVIEGCHSNLLVLRDGRWLTPNLRWYGVRGVMLHWLAGQVEIGEDDIRPLDLHKATELAVCNSVRGVVPARLLTEQPSPGGPQTIPPDTAPVVPGAAVSALQYRISEKLW